MDLKNKHFFKNKYDKSIRLKLLNAYQLLSIMRIILEEKTDDQQ